MHRWRIFLVLASNATYFQESSSCIKTHTMRNQIILLLILFLLGCSKDELQTEDTLFKNNDHNYPTSIKKLSKTEIEKRQKEFEEGQLTFSLIDSFGFVGWSYDDDFEVRKQLYSEQFSNINSLTTLIKLYLFDKGKFTGITDTSQLVPKKIDVLFQDYGGVYSRTDDTKYNHLGIDFGTQSIGGLEVISSLLTVSATANGVHYIFGHWYSNAYIPQVDQVTVKLAKSILVGRKLTSYNGWGQESNQIIAEENLVEYRKVIYPFINGAQLELRVCWEFNPSHWQILMDTSTGEILVEQDVAIYPL